MKKALILEFETMADLADQVAAITAGYNNAMSKEIIPTDRGEVNGKIFEKMMSERGYKVVNPRTKKARCEQFKIKATMRGKEWHYRIADIERVPQRR